MGGRPDAEAQDVRERLMPMSMTKRYVVVRRGIVGCSVYEDGGTELIMSGFDTLADARTWAGAQGWVVVPDRGTELPPPRGEVVLP